MKDKFGTREKIIILAVLIAIEILINTVTPVSYTKTSLNTTESGKAAVSCAKTDQNLLSSLFVENSQKNEDSCLFIGCGSAF